MYTYHIMFDGWRKRGMIGDRVKQPITDSNAFYGNNADSVHDVMSTDCAISPYAHLMHCGIKE